ncbi:TPR domain protein [Aspergillus cavernicola]|uniref:TPR domain protein n=1 Tax=Aspergillus cavernicola TaxID=176166 RepID=A0ABR4IXU9_9EURO
MEFMFERLMHHGEASPENSTLYSTFIPPAYLPCVTPLNDLRKVMLDGLLLETHHRDRYVLLRAVTPSHTMNGVMVIVEDENSDVSVLVMYNQEERVVNELLREGTVMILKEPYLKLMSDGGNGVRVDHLSDIIFLPPYDARVPAYWRKKLPSWVNTAMAWKEEGNEFFKSARFNSAIECYTQALNHSPTDDQRQALRLNLGLASLKTEQYDASIHHFEWVINAATLTEKALWSKSQALHHMRKYAERVEVLTALQLQHPTFAPASNVLPRATLRLEEQKHGKYSFRQLYREAKKLRPPHLDHVTFIGPVEVRQSGTKGRGLFTTKAVKAGDLLLCEKAFAHAYVNTENIDTGQRMTLLINAENNTMTMGAQGDLIKMIVQRLYQNPSLASTITDLHHGLYEPTKVTEVDGTPVVDTFLVERIIAMNVFGCPLTTRDYSVKTTLKSTKPSDRKDELFHSCGIWPTASYINHSCDSNARRAFIGDMMIIRASRDLPANTEVTFIYRQPVDQDSDACQTMFDHWGFQCNCAICNNVRSLDKTTMTKRKSLKTVLKHLFNPCTSTDAPRVEATLKFLAQTYSKPATEVPCLCLWEAQLALASLFMRRGQPVKAIHSAFQALRSLGFVVEGGLPPFATGLVIKRWGLMVDSLVELWILLADAYSRLAPGLRAPAWEYASITYRVCVGESETFEEMYGGGS